MELGEYAFFVAVVFAINLMPAFAPPTWLVVTFFAFTYDLELVPLVLLGATTAAAGRWLLALGSRALRGRMSDERLADLNALRDDLERHPSSSFAGLALFLVSPLPAAQMFEAAGVTGVPLRPLVFVFWIGRLISYTIYGTAATLAAENFEEIIKDGFSSPWFIILNVLMLGVVVAIALLPWRRILQRLADRRERRAGR